MSFLLALILFHVSEAAPYRGYVEVEKVFSERLLEEEKYFTFAPYLSSGGDSTAASNLLFLLGHYASRGGNEFRNGKPNAISMLLWSVVLQFTAEETKNYCQRGNSLHFHLQLRSTLDGLCAWPAPQAKSESLLRAFWLSVMAADAPESEYEAWREFALTSSVAAKSASDALPELFFAIVYNPYFLLRQ